MMEVDIVEQKLNEELDQLKLYQTDVNQRRVLFEQTWLKHFQDGMSIESLSTTLITLNDEEIYCLEKSYESRIDIMMYQVNR
jgi:hypothetical protein